MSYPKRNQKLPEDPRFNQDDSETTTKYPYITGEVNRLGSEKWRYENPYEEDKSIHATLEVNGSYTFDVNHSEDGKELKSSFNNGQARSYTSGGSSSSSEGGTDHATWGSSRDNVAGDKGQSIVKDKHTGIAGSRIDVAQRDSFYDTVNGRQTKSTDGEIVEAFKGRIARDVEGSLSETISGNKIIMVAKSNTDDEGTGEYGINVQDGNMDTQIDQGKYRVKAGNDITIDSTTKITIVVGSSSIVLEPSKITIKSPAVEFIKG